MVDALEFFNAVHFKEWSTVHRFLLEGQEELICDPLVLKAIWESYEDERHVKLEPEWVSCIELMADCIDPNIIFKLGILIYDPKILEVLILRGLNPRKRYPFCGYTLVQATVGATIGTSEFTETDKRLIAVALNYGLSINALNKHGENLFFQIVKNIVTPSELEKLDLLLRLGSFINIKDADGNTPLHVVAANQVWLADWLIRHGADLEAKNEAGRTPALEAENKGYLTLALFIHDKQKEHKTITPPDYVAEGAKEAQKRIALRVLKYGIKPEWIPDDLFEECWECATHFQLLTRRHHCRLCGYIFCKFCTAQTVMLNRVRVRVCDTCYTVFNEYKEDPNKSLKDDELKRCLGLSRRGTVITVNGQSVNQTGEPKPKKRRRTSSKKRKKKREKERNANKLLEESGTEESEESGDIDEGSSETVIKRKEKGKEKEQEKESGTGLSATTPTAERRKIRAKKLLSKKKEKKKKKDKFKEKEREKERRRDEEELERKEYGGVAQLQGDTVQ